MLLLARWLNTVKGIHTTTSLNSEWPDNSVFEKADAIFVFCDGATRFVSETIDGTVYAKLITPAGGLLPRAIRQGPLRQEDFME